MLLTLKGCARLGVGSTDADIWVCHFFFDGVAGFGFCVEALSFFRVLIAPSLTGLRPTEESAPLVPELVFFGGAMSQPVSEKQPGDEFKGASPESVKEIIRQGELRLQAQLQAALAADSRSNALAAIQAAAAAALVVYAGSADVKGTPELTAFVGAVFFTCGAMFAAWAARPIAFDFAGLNPSDWVQAIESGEPVDSARRAYATYLDEYLKDNAARMSANGDWTMRSIKMMAMAPAASAVTMYLRMISA